MIYCSIIVQNINSIHYKFSVHKVLIKMYEIKYINTVFPGLIVFVDQIYPQVFLKNLENVI